MFFIYLFLCILLLCFFCLLSLAKSEDEYLDNYFKQNDIHF